MNWHEVPPTAGLPLQFSDFLPTQRNFSQALASFLNVEHTQLTCSGTAALVIILTTFKQQSRRQEVIVPAYTCPLVALAVLNCGLTPVLCDLRRDHFDLDVQQLAECCNENTLAIITTHLGGRVSDVTPVINIARKHGAFVVEDAAQSLGAKWQGESLGLQGDAGFFSLAVGKGLTTFEGGILISNHPELRESFQTSARQKTPYQWGWELQRCIELLGYGLLYQPWGLPWIYGIPLRNALKKGQLVEAVGDDFSDDLPLHTLGQWRQSIGAHALQRLPTFITRLKQQAQQRLARLKTISSIQVIEDGMGGEGVWPFFMVLLPNQQLRDDFLARYWGSGLGVSRLYIHALPDYHYLSGRLKNSDTPNARDFASKMLTLSNSHWMSDKDFHTICSALERL